MNKRFMELPENFFEERMKQGSSMVFCPTQLPDCCFSMEAIDIYTSGLQLIGEAMIVTNSPNQDYWFNPTGWFAKNAEVGDRFYFCDTTKDIKRFRTQITANMYRVGVKVSFETVIGVRRDEPPFHLILVRKVRKD